MAKTVKTLELKPMTEYECVKGNHAWLIGPSKDGDRWAGYIIREKRPGLEALEALSDEPSWWLSDGSHESIPAYSLKKTHIEPRRGELLVHVYYSPGLGIMYRTTEPEHPAPAIEGVDHIVTKRVEWTEGDWDVTTRQSWSETQDE